MVLSANVEWTSEESEALRQAVKECVTKYQSYNAVNVFYNLPWKEIAKKFPLKTNDMCRRHWFVYKSVYIC